MPGLITEGGRGTRREGTRVGTSPPTPRPTKGSQSLQDCLWDHRNSGIYFESSRRGSGWSTGRRTECPSFPLISRRDPTSSACGSNTTFSSSTYRRKDPLSKQCWGMGRGTVPLLDTDRGHPHSISLHQLERIFLATFVSTNTSSSLFLAHIIFGTRVFIITARKSTRIALQSQQIRKH